MDKCLTRSSNGVGYRTEEQGDIAYQQHILLMDIRICQIRSSKVTLPSIPSAKAQLVKGQPHDLAARLDPHHVHRPRIMKHLQYPSEPLYRFSSQSGRTHRFPAECLSQGQSRP